MAPGRPAHDTGAPARAAQAMTRVLRSEQDAGRRLTQVREQAQAALDAARDDGLDIVNRAMERIAAWRQAHGVALEQRLATLRSQAAASAPARDALDDAAIAAAVEQVADQLSAAAPAGPR
ncbi:MAG: hypothetical protein Q8N44_06235 [Rubrivivax sp.]|nr:hypothetical protein [Rubrivivax sp.]